MIILGHIDKVVFSRFLTFGLGASHQAPLAICFGLSRASATDRIRGQIPGAFDREGSLATRAAGLSSGHVPPAHAQAPRPPTCQALALGAEQRACQALGLGHTVGQLFVCNFISFLCWSFLFCLECLLFLCVFLFLLFSLNTQSQSPNLGPVKTTRHHGK